MPSKRFSTVNSVFWGDEPEHTGLANMTTVDLIKALTWYGKNTSKKDRKAFAITYAKTLKDLDVKKLSTISEELFTTIGSLSRMVMNGMPLQDNTINKLYDKLEELISTNYKPIKKAAPIKKRKSTVNIDNAFEYSDQHIDDIMLGRDTDLISGDYYNPLNKKEKDELRQYLQNHLNELNDKSLNDCYTSNKTMKTDMKKAYQIMIALLNVDKKTKILKSTKPKSAINQTKKVKYMTESVEYGFKSINPSRVVGKNKLIVFNNKTRQIGIYYSEHPKGFTVKGTTLQGFDPMKSTCKTDRKPMLNTSKMILMTDIQSDKFYHELKAVDKKMKGRFSDDVLILKVF